MTNARTTEVDDTSDRLIVLYKNEPTLAEDPFLASLFTEMETVSKQITQAIKRDRTLSELDDADAMRDNAVRNLQRVLLGFASMPIDNLRKSGEKLYAVFNKYGLEILRENYAEESSLIESMLIDFANEAFKADIAALPGVLESVGEVRRAQTDFTHKRVAYEEAIAAAQRYQSASALKKPLLQLINASMVPYLSTMQMVDADKYGQFADAAAQVIEDTNAAVLRRRAKPAADREA